ncbi:helix-turn-helix domain-containing protein [Actinoplanes sp. NBC_00393]|uniref:helix-turn-helix domain-containing protein n=1 Tax=Actinoplanes sp. NBC_00393 TaxID=2975953 RepID=UPI002E1E2102
MTAPLFATLLRTHRQAARMTQHELAGASGVSVRAISDMERGHSAAPQHRTLDALAAALNLDAAQRSRLAHAVRASRDLTSGAGALPRDLRDFTGRHDELALLADACRPGTVTVVHGPPGVGKTALAVHAAGRFDGAVCFVDGRADVRDRLLRIGDAGRLLILDDLPDEALPPLPWGDRAIMITSRWPLRRLGPVQRLRLRPFPLEDAVRLLATITGADPRDPATRAVAAYCEHLPLALRVAGNRLATRPGWTMPDLAARLADENRRLSVLTAGDLSVERVYADAYLRLSPEARRAYLDLADLGLLTGLAHLAANRLRGLPAALDRSD